MSYLSQSLRLHFAGQFQATVSTVNNDVTHFNNASFQPEFQLRQDANGLNGWWNPAGDGVWRLLGCDITSAFMADGTAVAATDPALACQIADSDLSAPAKIVDLDPQQQMVSTIFGLTVRIADASGNTLMKGRFEPSAFTELWSKVWAAAGGDAAYGAMWQSVVTVTEWGDVSGSAFLVALKKAADANDGLLSIKFNVDLYSMQYPQPDTAGGENFCRGRIVGTMGPATAAEPARFVAGRQLYPALANGAAVINFCQAVLDKQRKVLRLDLGNALPVRGDGTPVPLGDLLVSAPDPRSGRSMLVGRLPQATYTNPSWYPQTAGIVEFPLTKQTQAAVASAPLGIAIGGSSAAPVVVQEMQDGLYVRADLFVYRLSPGQTATATFYATRFGEPLPKAEIAIFNNPAGLQGAVAPSGTTPGTLTADGEPFICAPEDGVLFPLSVTTDAKGKAQMTIVGGNTQNFRAYIDGQIYGIGYGLTDQNFTPGDGPVQSVSNMDAILANPWNFISVLVFDAFQADSPPTWWGSMEPIFQQYANLYPVMARFVDLGDYDQVKSYARMLLHAFSLPEEDPNAMPVTRDLSPAKRAAILTWLKNPLPGTPPVKAMAAAPAKPVAEAAPQSAPARLPAGGKAAAMARRVGSRGA